MLLSALLTTAIPTPTVQKSPVDCLVTEDICIGSIHASLVENGIEAVIQDWPKLQPYQQILESVLQAEHCRAAHLKCAADEESKVDSLLKTLEMQLS